MKAARDYLDFVDELMESARSADPGSDAERYDLAAAQVAATSALAAATLEAAAAADQPERFAAPAPAPLSQAVPGDPACGSSRPVGTDWVCKRPGGHAGPHAAWVGARPVTWAAASVLCGALPPGSVTTLRGIYCEEPHGHTGTHRAVPPTYYSDDAVTW